MKVCWARFTRGFRVVNTVMILSLIITTAIVLVGRVHRDVPSFSKRFFATMMIMGTVMVIVSLLARWWLRSTKRPRLRRADRIFGVVSALVPPRIADEELGDALEDLRARIANRRPAWEIRLKIGATVFWVFVHTLHYLLRKLAEAAGLAELLKAFRR